ncbi:MotA/TolQ/ExbB proton channel family protein [bacterium]|nr:MotA/TolQ/ExbB proton channel family protein [bacterium]
MSVMSQFWRSFIPDLPDWSFLFMWVIAFLAAVMIAISIDRFSYVFIKSSMDVGKFMALIRKYIQGKELKRAVSLCHTLRDKALPKIVLLGLIRAGKMEKPTFRAIQNAVDEGTLEVIPKLQARTGYLNMIANVSTLIGLMGTIWGLIYAFNSVSSTGIDAAEKSSMLAHGIAVAMNTTFFGLAVAILSIFSYTILHNKTNQLIDEIDEHTVKLINLMTEEE